MPTIGPDWALSPQEWGAQKDYDSWSDTFTPDDGIALHNGGDGRYPAGYLPADPVKERRQLREWEDYHLGKGWRGLAYGWAVGQSGNVYRIRGWNRYGAHLGDVDGDGIANNDEVIPVLWIGDGNHQSMSPAAVRGFERLRAWLEAESDRDLWLYGHKEVQDSYTPCPGSSPMAYVVTHRTSASDGFQPDPVKWPATLRRTDRHLAVPALRGLLYATGYLNKRWLSRVRFTRAVERAVRRFQRAERLTVDGIVGPMTRQALAAEVYAAAKPR